VSRREASDHEGGRGHGSLDRDTGSEVGMTHAETIVVSRRGGWGDRLKRHRDGKEGGEGSGQGEGREGRGPLWGKGLKPREGMEDGERAGTDAGRRAGVSSWANGRRWATDARNGVRVRREKNIPSDQRKGEKEGRMGGCERESYCGLQRWSAAKGRAWGSSESLCREMETTPGEREKVCILCRREGGDTPSVDGSG